jgi:putative membrane protein
MMLAHDAVAPSELWSSWHPEPLILATLALTALLYHQGLAHQRAWRRPAARTAEVVAFSGGLLALAVALASPLEGAASSLFAAHMAQHLLLMMVAAPLLVLGRPVVVLSQAVPRRWRRVVRARTRRRVRVTAHSLSHPAVVWAVGVMVLWAWHLPTLYEVALSHDSLHALEHVSLVASSALVWALALGRGPRSLATPAAVMVLFATALQSGALGAVLALARTPLYPIHAPAAPLWGLTPLEDQQLAGVLMWVPPGLVYVTVMAGLLVRWFASVDIRAHEPAGARGPS